MSTSADDTVPFKSRVDRVADRSVAVLMGEVTVCVDDELVMVDQGRPLVSLSGMSGGTGTVDDALTVL